jgi:hypothetical protein
MVTMTQSYPACWLPSGLFTVSIANRPVSSVKQIAYRLNAKPFGLGDILNFFSARPATDKVSGHFARNLGQAVSVFSADALTTFCGFVSHVLGLRPKPKVIGVHASGCVASVQNAHSIRNGVLVNGVGVSVSQALYGPADTKEPVTVWVASAIPNPTITAFIDVAEKTNGGVFGLSGHEVTLTFSEVV